MREQAVRPGGQHPNEQQPPPPPARRADPPPAPTQPTGPTHRTPDGLTTPAAANRLDPTRPDPTRPDPDRVDTDRLDTAEIAAEAEITAELNRPALDRPEPGRADLDAADADTAELPVPPGDQAEAGGSGDGGGAGEQGERTGPAAERPVWQRPPRRPVKVHVAFTLVLVIAAVGVLRIAQYHWREGSVLIGGALLVAALLRAVLPATRVGLMAVRGRAVDVLTYSALAACVLFISITLQNGPYS
jgi:hypothetical protein